MALYLSVWFHLLLVCGFTTTSTFADDECISIEEHPSSILIPVNETAVFSCKASCRSPGCTSAWFINRVPYIYDTQEQLPIGFSISQNRSNVDTNKYFSSLSINTSVATVVNGSNISCLYNLMGDSDCLRRSSKVELLLISDPPISPNPRIDIAYETHINVTWSPPFLWPGHRIKDYNVSFITLHDGVENSNSYIVNSTYTSETVSLAIEIQQHQINILCSNYTLVISPIGTSMPVQINITDTIIPKDQTSHDQCNGQSTSTPHSTESDVSVFKDDDGGILLYKVSMFVSLSLAAIFFGLLILLISCACLCYRKKQKEKKTIDVINNIYKMMIPNPIYDGSGLDFKPGPVYECIKPPEPTFCSRPGPDYRHAPMTVPAIMNDIVQSHSEQQEAAAVKSTTSTGCHANVPGTVTPAPKRSGKERNKLHLTLSLTETNTVNPLMSRSHGSDVTESMYPCSPTRVNNHAQAVKSHTPDQHGIIVYGNSEHYDV